MDNPFLRRATEFLREDEAFLAIICPEPVTFHLKPPGEAGSLYDRLVLLRGTPGSGKTTLARLFEFPTLYTLLRNFASYRDLYAALSACRAIENEQPRVLGCRLSMESDYRAFWECPYSGELKTNLMASLLQARSVLSWFRHLRMAGISPEQVEVITRPESKALLDTIGGGQAAEIAKRAEEVENSIYKVMTALVAPPESTLSAYIGYRPFDHIERIRIPPLRGAGVGSQDLIPLVIFDDAHALHPEQFQALERFLVRRELRIARWVIARFDVLMPEDALAAAIEDRSDSSEYPGVTAKRDTEVILLQTSGRRWNQRVRFRALAKDMATRYLRRMPLMSDRGLTTMDTLLSDAKDNLSPGRLKDLEKAVDATQAKLVIPATQRKSFEAQIGEYWGGKTPLPTDVGLAMLQVMFHRADVRRRRSGPSLFETPEEEEEESVVAANDKVYEAATYQLFRAYDQPYYFGIDSVCDASSENAEQFLRLSADLVEAIATQLARAKPATLTPSTQHKLLQESGAKTMEKWNFPQVSAVRRIVKSIADLCLKKSLEPNGAVIANAYGIPQSEFDSLGKSSPELARALQFAVAYNAITLVPRHSCKKKEWCLLELGGVPLLSYGLTLKRGGFVEGSAVKLRRFLAESPA